MIKYIVECRSTFGQPSLFAFDNILMVEITADRALRMTEAQARERARKEKALRPGRKVLIIKVTS
jgi:hypothetical protein